MQGIVMTAIGTAQPLRSHQMPQQDRRACGATTLDALGFAATTAAADGRAQAAQAESWRGAAKRQKRRVDGGDGVRGQGVPATRPGGRGLGCAIASNFPLQVLLLSPAQPTQAPPTHPLAISSSSSSSSWSPARRRTASLIHFMLQ
jgi:hypothetical protein